ncbi:MAG: helix-turn-helix domain-containing protein [Methanomassiliicoccales archaeon]|nr:MAG: helix-turn-helix domain-containing protein [Methanomassiliicoccales archaeon]
MRKLILEIEPNENWAKLLSPIFEKIQSYEVLEIMKCAFEEGVRIHLAECVLKEAFSIHDVKYIGHYEMLNVLKSEGNKHTCLIKITEPEGFMELFKEFDLDLIYTTPMILSEEIHTYSCIGDQENISKFVEVMKTKMGNVVNMSFQKAAHQKHDILSVLTDKQREILIAAKKNGYYDLPKKINSEQLSQKVNISKATLLEHLRKAEERIMENILAGY